MKNEKRRERRVKKDREGGEQTFFDVQFLFSHVFLHQFLGKWQEHGVG